jgi:hypothetical protein
MEKPESELVEAFVGFFAMAGVFQPLFASDAAEVGEYLRERGESATVLLCCSSDKLDFWLWDTIRASFLNPVVVVGFSPYQEVTARQHVFLRGVGKYHKYVAPPWKIPELYGALQNVAPLHNEEHRHLIVEKYGGVLRRIHSLVGHDLRGKNNPVEQGNILNSAKTLAELSGRDDLAEAMDGLLALIGGDQDEFQALRRRIIDQLQNQRQRGSR